MRKPILTMLLAGAFLLMFSTCKKDSEVNIDQIEITDDISSLGTNSVTISGTYSYSGTIDGITAHLSENGVHPKEFVAVISGKNFAVEMTELSPGTTYQYYYSVDYGFSKPFKTGTRSFTTKSETPSVKALEVLEIDSTTFRIKCEALSDGGQEVTERGIYWNTYGDPTIGDNTIQSAESGLGLYTIRMENLAMGKKYFVRAYAKNAAGIGLSEEVLDFETEVSAGASVDIELSCNPEEGGTVSGGGSYEVGTRCTATAVANTGYTFVNWTENDIQVSSNAEYTFTVTTGRNLVANFTKQAYVITAQVDPEDSGTVTGAGGYNYGEECTLTATAKTGYDFVKWTKGGTTVSTDAEYSFTVTATATYVAHFSIKSYSVSVSASPSNGGTVTGGGTFNYGELRTVHATPANGFAFSNWTDDGDEVSTDADYTFTVSSNRNLVANFTVLQPDEYSITVSANPSEGGTVTGSGTYQQGQSCTVKATSKPNFTFVNWTENGNQVSDLAEYTFTVTGNRVLVANFEAQAPTEYTVSVSANPSNGGTVTGGGTFQQGQQCTVTATANEGYNFTNWTEGGNVVSTQASYTFTVNTNRNLVANFSQQSYTINASASPSNGGTVSGAGSYNYGQSCTLSATAANGYTFTNWTENGNQVSTNANYTFTVNGNRTLVAQFQAQSYTITASANPSSGGSVSGGGNYNYGQSCTVHATANSGYTFTNWTENGNQVSTNANYTFTVTSNRTLVANFTANPQNYTISVSANPSNGGTVTGGGTYQQGQSCTVHATANSGYTFTNWTESGSQVSTNANYTFTVTSNRTLVANFTYNGGGNAPTGAINGLFTINPNGDQVYFSQGNLQYQASTNTWRFAENQWDYIGEANSNISPTYNGWIDLFGFGTSGWDSGNTYFRPWDTDYSNDFLYGPPGGYDLTGVYANADWGVYNSIINGGNSTNTWRSLTGVEWRYILYERNTNSGIRFAEATVNNVNGVIILPDNWSSSYFTINNANPSYEWGSSSFEDNIINASQWSNLEQHGVIFLSASGWRYGTSVSSVGSCGYYWTASNEMNSHSASGVSFDNHCASASSGWNRYHGSSVRLVQDY